MFASDKRRMEIPTCPEGHRDLRPEAGHGEEGEPVDQEAQRQGDQGQVPEPEEQEELLVDNVVRKNTNGLTISRYRTIISMTSLP